MDPATHRRMRTAHAKHTHTCICGKTVRGNGGWASHRWACPIYQGKLEEYVAATGHVSSGAVNVRRGPSWRYDEDACRWIKRS